MRRELLQSRVVFTGESEGSNATESDDGQTGSYPLPNHSNQEVAETKEILVAAARSHPNSLVLPFEIETIRIAA